MLGSGPSVSYFIRCGIIFLNDVGVLLVIFLPKVYAQYVEVNGMQRKVGIAREKLETNAPVYGEEGLNVSEHRGQGQGQGQGQGRGPRARARTRGNS